MKHKTIFVRISDGDNVTAYSTKKKVINLIKEIKECSNEEAKEIFNDEWLEVTLN